MPLMSIIPDTDPIMRKTSRKIRHVDDELKKLVEDMYETMVSQYGVGLAAVQVGVLKRFFVYEVPHRVMNGYETCYDSDNETDVENQADGEGDADESADPAAEVTETEEPDNGGYTGDYTVCINPRIIDREGEFIDDEGCLSKEGWMAKVKRAIKVTFQAYDINMKKFERTVTGLEARCVQHEIDHLDGILFTDRAEPGTIRDITAEDLEEETEDTAEPEDEGETNTEQTENEAAQEHV